MEKLISDLAISVLCGTLTSLAYQNVKDLLLKQYELQLSKGTNLILSILLTVFVAWVFLMYYQGMELERAAVVTVLSIVGGQTWYHLLTKEKVE